MRGSFNILEYWIKELRKIAEFKEIAKVENIEFERLYGATDLTLDNLFIETADETAIKHFEKICNIYPDDTDTLEYRRSRLYSYWVEKQPYTEEELWNRLNILCDGKFEIIPEYENYLIHIITRVGIPGLFDEIIHILDYFLPANIVLDVQNVLTEDSDTGFYAGIATQTAMSYTVTNDVNSQYPVDGAVGIATVAVGAMSNEITNDVNVNYPVGNTLYVGIPDSTSFVYDINDNQGE